MTRPNWSRCRGFASTGLSAALDAPAVGHAHPRRVHRAPVEVEADDVAVGEGEPVVLQRLDHLDALPAREREVAQVALGGQRRVPVVDVVRRLQVEPRGVVEHEHATAGDPDGRSHVVVAPASELALGVEEPEPERLVLPPVIRLRIVEVVVVEERLVAFAEFDLVRELGHRPMIDVVPRREWLLDRLRRPARDGNREGLPVTCAGTARTRSTTPAFAVVAQLRETRDGVRVARQHVRGRDERSGLPPLHDRRARVLGVDRIGTGFVAAASSAAASSITWIGP